MPCLFYLKPLGFGLSFLGLIACSPQASIEGDLAITNVDILNIETGDVVSDQMVVIADGLVLKVQGNHPDHLAASVEIIDGQDRILMPALWDSHGHFQIDPEGYDDRLKTYQAAGITHIRDLAATYEELSAYQNWAEEQTYRPMHLMTAGPRLVSEILPYGDPAQFERVVDAATIRHALQTQQAEGVDFAKIYGPLSSDVLAQIDEIADELGLPLAGHVPFGISLKQMADIAPVSIEHISYSFDDCGPPGIDAFNQGIAARFRGEGNQHRVFVNYLKALDLDLCAPVFDQLGSAGTAWVPTVAIYAGYGKNRDRSLEGLAETDLCLREDAAWAAEPDIRADMEVVLSTLLERIVDAGISVLAGSDAPAFCVEHGQGLITEIKLLSRLGLTPLEALQSATLQPAEHFGFREEYGHIAPGYRADMILLDRSPLPDLRALETVSLTVSEGRIVYSKTQY